MGTSQIDYIEEKPNLIMNVLKLLLISSLLLHAAVLSAAEEQPYDVATIDGALKENADAVIRLSEEVFTISDIGKAEYHVKIAITILNKSGDQYADLYVFYDKLSKINDIEGRIYDAQGNLVNELSKKDVKDRSQISDFSLYEDNRVKYAGLSSTSYPYTVEYEYVKQYKGLIGYPSWYPVSNYNVSVENAHYTLITKKNIPLRYKAFNLPAQGTINPTEDGIKYQWAITDFKALEKEPYSPPITEFLPLVLLAPSTFEYDGYEGKMDNWQQFGLWIKGLMQGRSALPEATVAKIQKMAANAPNKREAVKKIYEYVQSRTRYVSIQLGIGGLQPFPASTVDNLGYGDCKALSNYTYALLKAAGIPSHYTVIGNHMPEMFSDFASAAQANHVILCVPLASDTVWLECTSSDIPFGYIGNGNLNTNALLITDEGGKLAATPRMGNNENRQFRTVDAEISPSGDIMADISTNYSGIQYDNIFGQFVRSDEDRRKNLYQNLPLSGFTITSFDYSQKEGPIPIANEHLQLQLNNYASIAGDRMFIPLNLLNKRTNVPPTNENRQRDVFFDLGFSDRDTIVYQIPDGYEIEYLPKEIGLKSDFAEYHSWTKTEGSTITYIRHYKTFETRMPPSAYQKVVDFYRQMVNSDHAKIVLLKKEK